MFSTGGIDGRSRQALSTGALDRCVGSCFSSTGQVSRVELLGASGRTTGGSRAERKAVCRMKSGVVRLALASVVVAAVMHADLRLVAKEFNLQLRQQHVERSADGQMVKAERVTRDETWPAEKTAIIVCDVWDYHHCLNAVRRLSEFAPRLNELLAESRRRGATIIHAPSDCMDAYAQHPARRRAMETSVADRSPAKVSFWCSQLPAEANEAYPIDQSDGGEDDDPAEHSEWANKLKQLGRNPAMPWKSQSDMIAIDPEKDFISDRGDEVWNVLESRGIKHVILTGVHVNMCVLGRPFGLRQMARSGKQVVLMRDLTDAMYNPKRWPYVDHYTGNDLVISHIEKFVCPTVTSDQILGGNRFEFIGDARAVRDRDRLSDEMTRRAESLRQVDWRPVRMLDPWMQVASKADYQGPAWYRCAVRIPSAWLPATGATLTISAHAKNVEAWVDGAKATLVDETTKKPDAGTNQAASFSQFRLRLPREAFSLDDHSLIVVRVEHTSGRRVSERAPMLSNDKQSLPLDRQWQMRLGDPLKPSENSGWSTIPLPAKFGIGSDLVYEP